MEFSQLAILLSTAAIFGVVSRLLKQPLLIGYLFAGMLLAMTGFLHDNVMLEDLGKIGVTLLLFLLGLEMNLKELPQIGKVALITGLGQIIFTAIIGFVLALILGFSSLSAAYISIALTFSSTIIIVKLLSEKNDLSTLYGRIAVGFLLIQDFVAMILLMFLSGVNGGGLTGADYLLIAIKSISLFIIVWILSKYVLPKLFEKVIGNSSEIIFIVSISWAIGVASFVAGPVGFTLEIGGFLAGLALSNLPEHLQIAARTRPLRDFFLTIFFLYLGTQLVIEQGFLSLLPQVIIFSVFVLIGNPIIVMILMGLLGYRKRTSFLAGLTVAQISEFSFVILEIGAGMGHVSQKEVAIIILVGVITMTISTYFILGADKIYKKISRYLTIFEKRRTKEEALTVEHDLKEHIVLIGSDRTGKVLTSYFKNRDYPFLVVDFNPVVYNRLTASNIPVIFGDMNDPDIIEAAGIRDARLIVSTVSMLDDNLPLLEYVSTLKRKPLTLFTAATKKDAFKLYDKGATLVIVPEIAAGEHLRHIFDIHGIGEVTLGKLGKSHFNRLTHL